MSLSEYGGVAPRQFLINALWNIFGRVAPVFVAIATTPKLIHMLGLSRWGVFTILLTFIGTFGIFDLGLGRALSRAVATGDHDKEMDVDTKDLVYTGMVTLTGIGVIAAIVCSIISRIWVEHGMKIPDSLKPEVLHAFYAFSATAPLVIINAVLWGILTGRQAYKQTNLINIPISIMYYVGPLLMLYVWNSLVGIVFVLALCRIWMAVAYLRLLNRLLPELRTATFRARLLKPLLEYGGWMTVSNIVYPLLGYLDRFVISIVIPAARVAFYTTPSDAVSRFNMFSGSINASAFTAISSNYARNPTRTCDLYKTSVISISIILMPLCLMTAMFSETILSLWIDPAFAAKSALAMTILCLGVFLSGADSITATFLEAIGRPDIGTKISIVEILLYIPLLYIMAFHFDIVGASVAWSFRYVLDYLIRLFICMNVYPVLRHNFSRILVTVILCSATILSALIPASYCWRVVLSVSELAFFGAFVWFYALTVDEREHVSGPIATLLARARRIIKRA
ncbi:flippase [Gluconobacter sp. OJB]|uniref:flippase n=1 Tax=Gluconobacter sp. OJB TaxID=3145196 RepID=UPI0031FA357E